MKRHGGNGHERRPSDEKYAPWLTSRRPNLPHQLMSGRSGLVPTRQGAGEQKEASATSCPAIGINCLDVKGASNVQSLVATPIGALLFSVPSPVYRCREGAEPSRPSIAGCARNLFFSLDNAL